MQTLNDIINNSVYVAQALVAFWAVFCGVVVWRRTGTLNFRSLDRQDEFLDQLQPFLTSRAYDDAIQLCEDDPRAVPQLATLALADRHLEPAALQQTVVEHFQRDVLSDLDYRMSWVSFAIKTEPMLGLLGTVLGMMGAFANLASGDKVDPTKLANDISFALITTAIGLAVAVPLMLVSAIINVRIRKLEDRISAGLTRLFDMLKPVVGRAAGK
jgi:biopolymer transport protein ExbB/TolQ